MGVFEFWGPYNKDPTIYIYGTTLGSPIFGNSHMGLGFRSQKGLRAWF